MNMDSASSTKSLTDKRLKEYTDEDIWSLFTTKPARITGTHGGEEAINTPQQWQRSLTNGTFLIDLEGGLDGHSVPEDMDLKPQDYEKITIQLWDYNAIKSEDVVKAETTEELHYEFPELDQEFFIKCQFHVWPHTSIDPRDDERFSQLKQFDWLGLFKYTTMNYQALLSPAICCEIIRFCDKISGLKAFW
jgi:hypothetical protein